MHIHLIMIPLIQMPCHSLFRLQFIHYIHWHQQIVLYQLMWFPNKPGFQNHTSCPCSRVVTCVQFAIIICVIGWYLVIVYKCPLICCSVSYNDRIIVTDTTKIDWNSKGKTSKNSSNTPIFLEERIHCSHCTIFNKIFIQWFIHNHE